MLCCCSLASGQGFFADRDCGCPLPGRTPLSPFLLAARLSRLLERPERVELSMPAWKAVTPHGASRKCKTARLLAGPLM